MADVRVQWTTVPRSDVPNIALLTQYRVKIEGPDPRESFEALGGAHDALFLGVAPGDYVAKVSLTSADMSLNEAEQSAAFNVPAALTVDAPDTVIVVIS